jgi:hypothetical protein
MKRYFSERNIVILLFILVLVTFSLAQEQSRAMEKVYTGSWMLQTNNTNKKNHTTAPIAGQSVQAASKIQ